MLLGLVIAATAGLRAGARGPSLDGEALAGAFVTMTPGARCPSVSEVAYSVQGEASGPLEGIFDLSGPLELTSTGSAAGIGGLTGRLSLNQGRVTGRLRWTEPDPPPSVSCDPLSFRLDGQIRYTVDDPFTDAGTVEVHAYGSRSAVTMPYFGRTTLTFRSTASR